ncbi:four-helix bundle copper-binding protein [Methylocystis sp. JAN1]|uniref:four-helix bundle copper-binding protein n=1 Tax=Methylocystis sp. JAN1 TaxID=3397211 RepID=UPI003FA32BEA
MQRREFIAAAGGLAVAASATDAFAQAARSGGMEEMHPALYKDLEKSAHECVGTGNDCLRHCFGMFSMKDTSMTDCAQAAFQLVAACDALASLAAVNSSYVPSLAKTVEGICENCKKECDKFPKVAACATCGDACKKCADECRRIGA